MLVSISVGWSGSWPVAKGLAGWRTVFDSVMLRKIGKEKSIQSSRRQIGIRSQSKMRKRQVLILNPMEKEILKGEWRQMPKTSMKLDQNGRNLETME